MTKKQPPLNSAQANAWAGHKLDPRSVILVVSSLVVYALAIIPLYQIIGDSTFFISLLPLLIAASFLGTWPALTVAALIGVFNLYVSFHFNSTWQAPLANGLASGALHMMIGAGVGRWRDLSERLKHELGERKQAEEKIRYLADHDMLTGLLNRAFFTKRLDLEITNARRTRQKLAVLFLDLNRFKGVNDAFGYEAGDKLLCEVAQRIRRSLKSADTAARFGADVFALALLNIRNSDEASAIAENMLATLSAPFRIGEQELAVTARMGIAIFPEDGDNRESILRYAGGALDASKGKAGKRQRMPDNQDGLSTADRVALEGDILNALSREEFLLHFQPQVESFSGEIVGMEALLRWRHPKRGLLHPKTFLSAAESAGVMDLLGEWVVFTACKQTQTWKNMGFPALGLAINLSQSQLRNSKLAENIFQVIRDCGLQSGQVELEFNENALAEKEEQIFSNLRDSSKMGMGLALDNFGSGYSCLEEMRRLPVSCLKISPSFILEMAANPDCVAVTHAAIAIAKTMRIKVVAVGVENEPQRSFLCSLQCDYMQGNYFMQPKPAQEITQFLMERWGPRQSGAIPMGGSVESDFTGTPQTE